MSTELDDLAREYREITAPEHIALKIRAETAERPSAGHRWLPLAAAAVVATVAVAVVGMPPTLRPAEDIVTTPSVKPSLSAIAATKVEKPAVAPPSLSRIRTPSAPLMPSKPRLERDGEQSRTRFEDAEEKQHAHT